jgi:signal transduction histidine kinase
MIRQARPRAGRLTDAGVAVLAFVGTLLTLRDGGFGQPSPGSHALDPLGVCLAAAASLPLVLSRAAPMTVYALVAAASLTLFAARYPLDAPFGVAVAAYQVGCRYGGAPRPVRAVAFAAVTLFVPATGVAYAVSGFEADVVGLLTELSVWTVAFAGIWLAGDRSRLRTEQTADLEQQARRAVREAERERRLAAAEERTRIARELHDSAGHAINVILVQAGAARLLHGRDPQRSQRAIAVVEQVARETIGEIDRLVRALREDDAATPPVPTDPAALEALLDRHRAAGLTIDGRVQRPPRPLQPSVSWAAYRILQEALTNAARHGTGRADVAVEHRPGAVAITVTNPVAPGAVATQGGGAHGVVGMRERATLLGGRLETSTREGLFRLHAWLPHGEPGDAEDGGRAGDGSLPAGTEARA